MPVLSNEQKAFIVAAFARFDGVAEVCRSFKDEFGLDLPNLMRWPTILAAQIIEALRSGTICSSGTGNHF
jgi:hypothetical protein